MVIRGRGGADFIVFPQVQNTLVTPCCHPEKIMFYCMKIVFQNLIADEFNSKVSSVWWYVTRLAQSSVFLESVTFFSLTDICGFTVISSSSKLKFFFQNFSYQLSIVLRCRQSSFSGRINFSKQWSMFKPSTKLCCRAIS